MNIYEHSTDVDVTPEILFARLSEESVLTTIMPRVLAFETSASQAWLRIDEPEVTVSWGSAEHYPGTLDVLPTPDPHRSLLVVHMYADTDVTDQLVEAVERLRATVEDCRVAA